MKKQKELVKICPQCGSTEIEYATQLGGANIGGGDHFYCRICEYGRYNQVVFDEIEKTKIESYKKKLRK